MMDFDSINDVNFFHRPMATWLESDIGAAKSFWAKPDLHFLYLIIYRFVREAAFFLKEYFGGYESNTTMIL